MSEVGIYPSREINAFATGRPGDSLIAISTGLIKNFTDEEIKGVLAHEISHLIHKDLRFILLVQGFCDLVVIVLSSLAFMLAAAPRKDEEESSGSQILRFIFAVLVYYIVTIILRIIAIAVVC
jgi:heat shock protein HtpX